MLSKDEQDRLDEIERALRDDDPLFAANVDFDHLRRHQTMTAGAAFILGIMVLVLGAVATQALMAVGVVVSVTGFVTMVAAAMYLWDRRGRGG
jgi:hypothetical protein